MPRIQKENIVHVYGWLVGVVMVSRNMGWTTVCLQKIICLFKTGFVDIYWFLFTDTYLMCDYTAKKVKIMSSGVDVSVITGFHVDNNSFYGVFQACRCFRVFRTQFLLEAPHWRGRRGVPEPRPQHAAACRDVFRELPSARPHAHHHSAAQPARLCDRCSELLVSWHWVM